MFFQNYHFRIIANEEDYLIQVFDKSGYGQDVDNSKRSYFKKIDRN